MHPADKQCSPYPHRLVASTCGTLQSSEQARQPSRPQQRQQQVCLPPPAEGEQSSGAYPTHSGMVASEGQSSAVRQPPRHHHHHHHHHHYHYHRRPLQRPLTGGAAALPAPQSAPRPRPPCSPHAQALSQPLPTLQTGPHYSRSQQQEQQPLSAQLRWPPLHAQSQPHQRWQQQQQVNPEVAHLSQHQPPRVTAAAGAAAVPTTNGGRTLTSIHASLMPARSIPAGSAKALERVSGSLHAQTRQAYSQLPSQQQQQQQQPRSSGQHWQQLAVWEGERCTQSSWLSPFTTITGPQEPTEAPGVAPVSLFIEWLPPHIQNGQQLSPYVPTEGLQGLRVKRVADRDVAFADYATPEHAYAALQWFHAAHMIREIVLSTDAYLQSREGVCGGGDVSVGASTSAAGAAVAVSRSRIGHNSHRSNSGTWDGSVGPTSGYSIDGCPAGCCGGDGGRDKSITVNRTRVSRAGVISSGSSSHANTPIPHAALSLPSNHHQYQQQQQQQPCPHGGRRPFSPFSTAPPTPIHATTETVAAAQLRNPLPYCDLKDCAQAPRRSAQLLRECCLLRASWARGTPTYRPPRDNRVPSPLQSQQPMTLQQDSTATVSSHPMASKPQQRPQSQPMTCPPQQPHSVATGRCRAHEGRASPLTMLDDSLPSSTLFVKLQRNFLDYMPENVGMTARDCPNGSIINSASCSVNSNHLTEGRDSVFDLARAVLCEAFFIERFAGLERYSNFLRPPYCGGCFVRFGRPSDALTCLRWMRSQQPLRRLLKVQFAHKDSGAVRQEISLDATCAWSMQGPPTVGHESFGDLREDDYEV